MGWALMGQALTSPDLAGLQQKNFSCMNIQYMHEWGALLFQYIPTFSVPQGACPLGERNKPGIYFVSFEYLFSSCLVRILHVHAPGICHFISMACFDQAQKRPFMHILDVHRSMHIFNINVYIYTYDISYGLVGIILLRKVASLCTNWCHRPRSVACLLKTSCFSCSHLSASCILKAANGVVAHAGLLLRGMG